MAGVVGGGGGPGGGVASVQVTWGECYMGQSWLFVTIYSVGCIGLLGSKLVHNLGVDEGIIKQQDSVADATAVEVGEEEAGDDLEKRSEAFQGVLQCFDV